MANEYQNVKGQIIGISNISDETKKIKTNENGEIIAETILLTGVATSGSTTTLVDSTKDFEADMLNGKIIKMTIGSKEYYRKITDSGADTITFPAINSGTSATSHIILAETFDITVTCVAIGVLGNSYAIKIIASPGANDNLSVGFSDDLLTISLGKTSNVLDNTKNTATLVTTAIDQLPEFTASATGSGVVTTTSEDIPFAGGIDAISVIADTKYLISI